MRTEIAGGTQVEKTGWWFQVSTHLKDISQIGSFPHVRVKIKIL